MLRDGTIPNIRYGRRFIVSRVAYEKWEAAIGETVPPSTAKEPRPADAASASSRNARPPKAA